MYYPYFGIFGTHSSFKATIKVEPRFGADKPLIAHSLFITILDKVAAGLNQNQDQDQDQDLKNTPQYRISSNMIITLWRYILNNGVTQAHIWVIFVSFVTAVGCFYDALH